MQVGFSNLIFSLKSSRLSVWVSFAPQCLILRAAGTPSEKLKMRLQSASLACVSRAFRDPDSPLKKNPEWDKITRTNSGVIISSCTLSDFRDCVLKARDNKGMVPRSRPFWKTRSTRQLRLGRQRTPHRNLTTVPLSSCIPAACVSSQMISTDPTISLQPNKNARLWWLEVNRFAKKTTCGECGSNGKLD